MRINRETTAPASCYKPLTSSERRAALTGIIFGRYSRPNTNINTETCGSDFRCISVSFFLFSRYFLASSSVPLLISVMSYVSHPPYPLLLPLLLHRLLLLWWRSELFLKESHSSQSVLPPPLGSELPLTQNELTSQSVVQFVRLYSLNKRTCTSRIKGKPTELHRGPKAKLAFGFPLPTLGPICKTILFPFTPPVKSWFNQPDFWVL